MTIEIKGEQETDMTEIETLRAEIEQMKATHMKLFAGWCEKLLARSDAIIAEKHAALEAAAPKPWPRVGDEYWCLLTDAEITNFQWTGGNFDAGAKRIGNVFPTQDAAEMERDRRRVSAIMREMADGGLFGICLSPSNFICTAKFSGGSWRDFGVYRFSTRELAQACLDRIVEMLSENGTRDGMARLLELWVAK